MSLAMLAGALPSCARDPAVYAGDSNLVKDDAAQREVAQQDVLIKAEQRLNGIEADIAGLKARKPTDLAERETFMSRIAVAEGQLATARTTLTELRAAEPGVWKKANAGLNKELAATQMALDKAAALAH